MSLSDWHLSTLMHNVRDHTNSIVPIIRLLLGCRGDIVFVYPLLIFLCHLHIYAIWSKTKWKLKLYTISRHSPIYSVSSSLISISAHSSRNYLPSLSSSSSSSSLASSRPSWAWSLDALLKSPRFKVSVVANATVCGCQPAMILSRWSSEHSPRIPCMHISFPKSRRLMIFDPKSISNSARVESLSWIPSRWSWSRIVEFFWAQSLEWGALRAVGLGTAILALHIDRLHPSTENYGDRRTIDLYKELLWRFNTVEYLKGTTYPVRKGLSSLSSPSSLNSFSLLSDSFLFVECSTFSSFAWKSS